ncbi:hypothetical protein F0562_014225 [Nyssa sinensis]|uniref:Uncharacterized protein n=1 Tax=Nyssa sinensis TaxID=561372 RepID=A0A5J4ZS52_9ASTE|nr:hypothetical protein F0562_014225 [Nyssa sinensis]
MGFDTSDGFRHREIGDRETSSDYFDGNVGVGFDTNHVTGSRNRAMGSSPATRMVMMKNGVATLLPLYVTFYG